MSKFSPDQLDPTKPPPTSYGEFIRYRLEKQLTAHPSKCWIIREVNLDNAPRRTIIFGPFVREEGEAFAKQLLELLQKLPDDTLWDNLNEDERKYVWSRLGRKGLDQT